MRRCWECRNLGCYKRDCKSKRVGASKDYEERQSIKSKLIQEEKGDVYLASKSTQSERGSWVIEYGASFHMTPHRNWFCEYEKIEGDDVRRGDDSLTKIIG